MKRTAATAAIALALLAPWLHKITPVYHHCATVCAPIHRIA